jgi:hypothetical protein
VDLQNVQAIRAVNVWGRTDCCADRDTDFDVGASADGVTWETIRVPGIAASPSRVLFASTPARYVRVQLRGTNFLHLGEVEVSPAR